MRSRSKVKMLVIALAILAALAGAAAGVTALVRRNSGKVDVYPVSDLITDASWVTDTQIEGFVTTDQNQSVYVSSTEQVTEVYVEEGQAVKAGDPILAFDTTLTDLELDRQRIKVEQLQFDIKNAEEELRIIGTLKASSGSSSTTKPKPSTPSATPTPTPTPTPPAETPTPPEELVPVSPLPYELDPEALGTKDDPFVYLWNSKCILSQQFFRKLAATAAERQEKAGQEDGNGPGRPGGASTPEQSGVKKVYVVFELRKSDAPGGELLWIWEMELTSGDGGNDWSFRVIDPTSSDLGDDDATSTFDPDKDPISELRGVYIDPNGSYTAAEIKALREDCTKRLKELNQELKMAELTYESLQYELSNGEVVSKLDGVVATLIGADEARLENKPMVVISGGGGYYVSAALGEMDLNTLAVGDTVTVQSWENYGEMEGYITEISEYPDDSGRFWYYSSGNRNVSLYPFKVYVDASAGLREGEYVTVSPVRSGSGSGAMFLDMSFVRQEGGQSYVYAVGEDGLLERRDIKTGRNLWGSYVEILSGLTEDESIAFPYGRKIRDGAKVRQAELQELYASMYY